MSRARLYVWLVVAVCLAVLPFGIEIWLQQSQQGNVAFDSAPIRQLNHAKPQIVLLGNSMLYTRIDDAQLSRVSGKTVMSLAQGGLASAAWWLQLKNYIAASKPMPETVVIFYRDHYLTAPKFRIEAEKYKNRLLAMTKTVEDRNAIWATETATVFETIQKIAGLSQLRQQVIDPMRAATWLATADKGDGKKLTKRINRYFRDSAYRKTDALDIDHEAEIQPFEDAVQNSFLPKMIDQARDVNLQLCFVHVKRRRDVMGMPMPSGLPEYLVALDDYFDSHDLCHVDMQMAAEITQDFFADGDHVHADKRAQYAKILWPRLARGLKK